MWKFQINYEHEVPLILIGCGLWHEGKQIIFSLNLMLIYFVSKQPRRSTMFRSAWRAPGKGDPRYRSDRNRFQGEYETILIIFSEFGRMYFYSYKNNAEKIVRVFVCKHLEHFFSLQWPTEALSGDIQSRRLFSFRSTGDSADEVRLSTKEVMLTLSIWQISFAVMRLTNLSLKETNFNEKRCKNVLRLITKLGCP